MSPFDRASFDQAYRADGDPWGYETDAYEQAKYRQTVNGLARNRYRRCFEPACSIGVLTDMLAGHCDAIVGCDLSPTAIASAERRLSNVEHVHVSVAAIPDWWPDGTFDLIVLSELGYYWNPSDWLHIVDRCRSSLGPGGEIIAVHWLGESVDHVQHGDDVHRQLVERLGVPDLHITDGNHVGERLDPQRSYVLDRWTHLT